jgi:hypothetical protein
MARNSKDRDIPSDGKSDSRGDADTQSRERSRANADDHRRHVRRSQSRISEDAVNEDADVFGVTASVCCGGLGDNRATDHRNTGA